VGAGLERWMRPLRRNQMVRAESGKSGGNKKASSLVEQLTQLKSLMDAGALTEEEFELAKSRLLGSQPAPNLEPETPPKLSKSPLNDEDSAKSLGRFAGKMFKERVKEWTEVVDNTTKVAPAALRAASRVATPRLQNAAEGIVNSTAKSLEDFGDFSAAVGKVAGRRAEAAVVQAENYRNAASAVVKNRANQAVLNSIGANDSNGALAWAAELEAKADKLEEFSKAPGRALSSVFQFGGAKAVDENAAEKQALEGLAQEAKEVARVAKVANEASKEEVPDIWAPATDPTTGRFTLTLIQLITQNPHLPRSNLIHESQT